MSSTLLFEVNSEYESKCFICLEENNNTRPFYGCAGGMNRSSTDLKVQNIGYHQICSECLAILRIPECACRRKIIKINLLPIVPDIEVESLVNSAIESNSVCVFEQFIKNNKISEKAREAAVLLAARKDQIELIRILLKSGHISEECRETAVVPTLNKEIIKIFLESGPISDKQRGEMILFFSRNGDTEFVKLILDTGPINDEYRTQAIEIHMIQRNREMVQLLLESSWRYFDVGRLLLIAIDRVDTPIVQMLLENGYISANDREIAIDKALKNSQKPILKVLLERSTFFKKITTLKNAYHLNTNCVPTCLNSLSMPIAITSLTIIAGLGIQYLRKKTPN